MRATSTVLLTAAAVALAPNVIADTTTTATVAEIQKFAEDVAKKYVTPTSAAVEIPAAAKAKSLAKTKKDSDEAAKKLESVDLKDAGQENKNVADAFKTLATAKAKPSSSAADKEVKDAIKAAKGALVKYQGVLDALDKKITAAAAGITLTNTLPLKATVESVDDDKVGDTKIELDKYYNEVKREVENAKKGEPFAVASKNAKRYELQVANECATSANIDTCVNEKFDPKIRLPANLPDSVDLKTTIEADKDLKAKYEAFTWAYANRTEIDKIDKKLFNQDQYKEYECEVGTGKTKVSIPTHEFAMPVFFRLAETLEVDDPANPLSDAKKSNDTDDAWCDKARKAYFFMGYDSPYNASFLLKDAFKPGVTPKDKSAIAVSVISAKCFHYVGDARALVVSAVATTVATAAIVASFL